jgi:polysaccharide biosynthesis transport protein
LNAIIENHNLNYSSGEIDIIKLVNSIVRGKWIILICILICIVLSNFYTKHFAVMLYSASAKIALEEVPHRNILTDIESLMPNAPITDIGINTELEVLRSRDLAGQLVDTLGLVNYPTFNKHLRDPNPLDGLKSQLFGFFGIAMQKTKSEIPQNEVRSNVINSVLQAMSFSNIRNSMVINISITTNDSALSASMANTMALLYIESRVQAELDTLTSAKEFLASRTSDLKHDFEEMKSKLAYLSSQSELVNPAVLEAQEIQLRDLRVRLSETLQLKIDKTKMLISLRSQREKGNLKSLISIANDFRLNRGISQYSNNKISLNDLNQIVDRFMFDLDAEVGRIQKQLTALEESEGFLTNQIKRQSHELILVEQYERETEAARLLYESFFKRLLEMNVQLGLETADVRLLSKAIQRGPSNSIKIQALFFSGVIGLIIGAGFVLFREMRFSGYRSVCELRDNSGHNVLASVPLIPARNRKSVISYLKNKPNSVISEAVRNLRTSIIMPNPNQITQVIMLTSSIPGEGKTILSFALAQKMVGLGKRVLLIEADIRRNAYSIDIDRKKTIKLVDILTGVKEFKNVDPFVKELGFCILTGAKSDINAADLFSSQSFSKLITELREDYDYILIDTPPVLAVPDARIIGALSDANIYIVEWNKTTRAQVDQGLDMLLSVGIKITGLVLNQIDPYKIKTYGYESQYGYEAYKSKYYEN